ncbi:MAG: hypothetical protein ACFFBR_02260 [Promethearchaeota archaeon]
METEAELRLTGLMTSPESEVAKTKLGQYLQEAKKLRRTKRYKDALLIVLVSAEYYWRKHQLTRAAGILLEASDLFYLDHNLVTSYRCLEVALSLMNQKARLTWWEKEMIGTLFLQAACLVIVDDPTQMSARLQDIRNLLSEKAQKARSREDGYRVAIALRRSINRRSLVPIDELETKTTLRIRSDYSTLYEYLQASSQRYAIIRDGLITLHREILQEED